MPIGEAVNPEGGIGPGLFAVPDLVDERGRCETVGEGVAQGGEIERERGGFHTATLSESRAGNPRGKRVPRSEG